MTRTLLAVVPKLGLYVGGFGILAMVGLIIAEVISTKIFNYSIPYVLEYSEYLVPVVVFWGAAYALEQEAHVRADIVAHHLPVRLRRWVFLAGYVIGLIFLLLVFWQFANVAWLSFKMNRYSFYPSPSPLWPPQFFVCVGMGLFIFQLIVEIARMLGDILRSRRDGYGATPDEAPGPVSGQRGQ
ncbi:MAG: TRAP transporter small permease [Reyranella sp.]|nr:TRAP transporter small permease [Reyranella sp.]